MRYVEAVSTTKKISKIGLGTWQFGSREWGYGQQYAEEESRGIVTRALDLGINLIDTAEIYGFGASERIVGRAVAGAPGRGLPRHEDLPGAARGPGGGGPGPPQRPPPRGATPSTCTRSTSPTRWCRTRPTMRAMRRLVAEGPRRHVGVSNYSLARWQAAEDRPRRPGPVEPGPLQPRGPPARGGPPPVRAQGSDRIVIAYSPLGQGLLSARYDATNRPGGVRAANALFLPENLERCRRLLEALRAVAAAHDATPAQVALAWVIRRPTSSPSPGRELWRSWSATPRRPTSTCPRRGRRPPTAADRFSPVTGPSSWAALAAERVGRS